MTETDAIFDIEAAPPDRAERKKLRSLYNKVGGAMVLQYVLIFVIYLAFSIALLPFMTDEKNAETGVDIVGWADALAMYIAPALSSIVMFFAFNAVNNVKSGAMFSTKGISSEMLGRCVLMAFAFHSVGMLLEYGVDIILYNTGYEVTAFDYEMKNDAATLTVELISSIIAAPIAEEMFFRGVLLKQTSRVSARFGIVFSAVMFGLMHGNPYQCVMATVLGLYLGYITIKTDSLIPSIVCHIAINALMSSGELLGIFDEELGDSSFMAVYEVDFLLGVLGIWLYKKSGEKVSLPPYTEYHKKRTLPIVITSVWVIIITLIYIYDIVNSVSPIPADAAEQFITSAV